jgi:hypothetical protein
VRRRVCGVLRLPHSWSWAPDKLARPLTSFRAERHAEFKIVSPPTTMPSDHQIDHTCTYTTCDVLVTAAENKAYCKTHREAAAVRKRKSRENIRVENLFMQPPPILKFSNVSTGANRTPFGSVDLNTTGHIHGLASDTDLEQPATKKPKVRVLPN